MRMVKEYRRTIQKLLNGIAWLQIKVWQLLNIILAFVIIMVGAYLRTIQKP